ncbi:MAG: glycosyltransferase family 39 protein [Methanoregula sp.]|uniref:ArnT family glycosyltransferase n=1 Tax=Methanoregula sp. TaxID=2052170 RepID=UPI0025EBA1B6|nr:glycosyltransferase family 39 protein [Methanoregula sp.]MCK9632535.1 glycosyltransferase family 39 protein [Methanoregula sp.]
MYLIDRDFIRTYRAEICLVGIVLLSAFLNLWNLWNQGGNAYYAAAVRSALVNPWAGFFGSVDPAGFITVDKPPVGIWVQALFAAVLGYQEWICVLPQALAGIGCVVLVYFIVSRPFGKPAGLISALALAVTPIFVTISRNETMDAQMIFVILLAVWVVLKAARERSLPYLLAAAALVGLAFNIKMIQAFIIVPAIFGVYLWGATGLDWKKRVLHLVLAAIVLLAVSFSWALVVDAIPADQRPHIGGSGDNTVLGLVINYNGIHRLGIGGSGMGGGPGGSFGSSVAGMSRSDRTNRSAEASGPATSSFTGPGSSATGMTGTPPGIPDSSGSTAGAPDQSPGMSGSPQDGASASGQGPRQGPSGMQQSSSGILGLFSVSGNGGGGMNSGGSPGLFRIFRDGLAGDIAWLLVFALIGVLAWLRKLKSLSLAGVDEAGYTGERWLVILAFLLWLVPGLVYFSFTSGFWHDYYIATIAPPIAGLIGIGVIGMYDRYVEGGRAGWLLVAAILVTGLLQALFLSYDGEWAGPLLPLVLAGTIVCTILLSWMQIRRDTPHAVHRTKIVAVALALLFIAPLVWSFTPMINGNGGTMPTAGPSGGRGSGPGQSNVVGMAGPGNVGYGAIIDSDATDTISRQGSDVYGMSGTATRLSDRSAVPGSGTGFATGGAGASAGPSVSRNNGGSGTGGGPGGMGSGSVSTASLAQFLLANTTTETWILVVPNAQSAADLIISTGKPVMCFGFMGSDDAISLTKLQQYVRDGKVRYFQTGSSGGGGGMGGTSSIFSWASSRCTPVTVTDDSGASTTLYDCKGASGTA